MDYPKLPGNSPKDMDVAWIFLIPGQAFAQYGIIDTWTVQANIVQVRLNIVQGRELVGWVIDDPPVASCGHCLRRFSVAENDTISDIWVKNVIFVKKHVFKAPRSRKYEHNALFKSVTASMVKIKSVGP